MLNANVPDVLIAALTSAAVALGVEWLAKPRLEARKERIFERHRALADVRRHLAAILLAASKLENARMPSELKEKQRDQWQREFEGVSEEIVSRTRSLEDAYLEVALSMPFRRITKLVSHYVGLARGVMLSDRTLSEKSDLIVRCTMPLLDAIGASGQGSLSQARWIYRARRLREAESLMLSQTGASSP